MENQFQRQEKDLEARLAAADASITDKMRQFKESRECQILPIMDKDNAISDEEMIKFMAKEEMNKMNEEERDLESRRRNIVIYRVPEKKTDVMAERKSNDTTFVKDLLDGVFNIDIEERYREDVQTWKMAGKQCTSPVSDIQQARIKGSHHGQSQETETTNRQIQRYWHLA